jgi:hypothetical protein
MKMVKKISTGPVVRDRKCPARTPRHRPEQSFRRRGAFSPVGDPRGKLVQRSPLHARKYHFSLIPENRPEQNAKTQELRRNKHVFPGGNRGGRVQTRSTSPGTRGTWFWTCGVPGGVFPDPLPPCMICGGFPPVLLHCRRPRPTRRGHGNPETV